MSTGKDPARPCSWKSRDAVTGARKQKVRQKTEGNQEVQEAISKKRRQMK
jgi:hypothetical protein